MPLHIKGRAAVSNKRQSVMVIIASVVTETIFASGASTARSQATSQIKFAVTARTIDAAVPDVQLAKEMKCASEMQRTESHKIGAHGVLLRGLVRLVVRVLLRCRECQRTHPVFIV